MNIPNQFRLFVHSDGKMWAVGRDERGRWRVLHGKRQKDQYGSWVFTHERESAAVAQNVDSVIMSKIHKGYVEVVVEPDRYCAWSFTIVDRRAGRITLASFAAACTPPGLPEAAPEPTLPAQSQPPAPAVDLALANDRGLISVAVAI